jgi:hypothetical protein
MHAGGRRDRGLPDNERRQLTHEDKSTMRKSGGDAASSRPAPFFTMNGTAKSCGWTIGMRSGTCGAKSRIRGVESGRPRVPGALKVLRTLLINFGCLLPAELRSLSSAAIQTCTGRWNRPITRCQRGFSGGKTILCLQHRMDLAAFQAGSSLRSFDISASNLRSFDPSIFFR